MKKITKLVEKAFLVSIVVTLGAVCVFGMGMIWRFMWRVTFG